MWGVLLILMGLLGIAFISVFEDITSTNDQNYYLVKEVTEAAMYDAIDFEYYRQTGVLKIDGEKFMENFVRRFAQSTNIRKDYEIKFHDIIESPPKVSVSVGSKTFSTSWEGFEMVNNIDAIFEAK